MVESSKRKMQEWVYHSRAVGGALLNPAARLGSGPPSSRNPAGGSLGRKAETSRLSSLHAAFQFWGGGYAGLSAPATKRKCDHTTR